LDRPNAKNPASIYRWTHGSNDSTDDSPNRSQRRRTANVRGVSQCAEYRYASQNLGRILKGVFGYVIMPPSPDNLSIPTCDLLVLLALSSEREALKEAAQQHGARFRRAMSRFGRYYDLGKIGDDRVIAVRASGMGPFGHRGSADLAIRFQQATGATAIVQLGMAFGIDQRQQAYGDVLVSSSLIPYDNRDYIQEGEDGYRVSYERAKRLAAGPILARFQNEAEAERNDREYSVHVGAILSGAARIHSETFRKELVASIPQSDEPVVGGEMEAIGLLGVDESPIWCIVKAISDFADSQRDEVIQETRPIACRNAAEFFFSTMLHPPETDTI
jgi:adenosylhomocysteine nucleosidase